MARTRAQEKAAVNGTSDAPAASPGRTESRKRSQGNIQDVQPPTSKRAKTEKTTKTTTTTNGDKTKDATEDGEPDKGAAKIQSIIDKHGSLPLSDTALEDPSSPAPETLLALLLSAMLSSTRISHELAAKTTAEVIKAGYHKIDTLKKSTWQERTEVLTEGGYTRYREKTATALGDLADLLGSKYDGDLNNLRKSAGDSPAKIRAALKEIKQLGDVGIDIFFDTAQGAWPCLAPFIDPRSKKTAESIGIGSDEAGLWKGVGKDPVQLCKLASALTSIRLEKKEAEVKP